VQRALEARGHRLVGDILSQRERRDPMFQRRLRGLPAAPERLAPADEAIARGHAHQQRVERGAWPPAEQRRRRPVIERNAERNRVDPFDGDSSH